MMIIDVAHNLQKLQLYKSTFLVANFADFLQILILNHVCKCLMKSENSLSSTLAHVLM